jgi:predicted ester cyclase
MHERWFELLLPGLESSTPRDHAARIPTSVLRELFDDAHELHQDLLSRFPKGPAGVRLALENLERRFANATVNVLETMVEGEMQATRFRIAGRHVGPLSHFPSTGKWVSTTGAVMTRFAAGRAIESWLEVDAYAVLSAVGALVERQTVSAEGATE